MLNMIKLAIPEVLLIVPSVHHDDRGHFVETYNMKSYIRNGIPIDRFFYQDNLSVSKQFVVRGLHWQAAPHAQGKLVSVTRGSVYDVAVDMRPDSPTFGKWVGKMLTANGHEQLYIPPGFAHGFQAMHDDTVFCYKCTDVYDSASERSLVWNDRDVNVIWPFPNDAVVAEKDRKAPTLQNLIDSGKNWL